MIAVKARDIEELGVLIPAIVDRLAGATGMTHSQAYRMRLAAEEITTNIVTHGYGGRGGTIDIEPGYDDAWVWVRIEDDAPEFDPSAYDVASRLAMDPGWAPLGGFGLFLALSSVDSLEHVRAGGRNRNLLKIRRGGGTDEEIVRTGRR
ncbi:ATP-binding protein [Amycolatopsis sp. FU40]|uniref:ATP-binding protein n=1 Tax=Amycolatopsis sp. FU40 TaxID=2914159 RepID=UPI001F365691|nr:ATP-binding protein [Amycolatopsis sp. FU40]UKD58645.1 ATP-binding protein [Amycolatopsis sp. FU40]